MRIVSTWFKLSIPPQRTFSTFAEKIFLWTHRNSSSCFSHDHTDSVRPSSLTNSQWLQMLEDVNLYQEKPRLTRPYPQRLGQKPISFKVSN